MRAAPALAVLSACSEAHLTPGEAENAAGLAVEALPAPGDARPGSEPALPPSGELHYPDAAALEGGQRIASSGPFQSFTLVVTADTATSFEYRAYGEAGWGEWQPAAIDWSDGEFRNGHQVLAAPATALEIRSSGGASFAQVTLFPEVEPLHDDDWPEGLSEGASAERAVAGMWEPAYDVWALAQGWYLPYEYATSCIGQLLPGSAELGRWLVASFGASSYQGYNCRYIDGSGSLSVHGAGRAIDLFVTTDGGSADNGAGDPIAAYLMEHAEEIGISLVIWDQASWGAHRSGDKHQAYSGAHPHHDHLHIELTTQGAYMLTPWFANPAAPGGEQPFVGYAGIAANAAGSGYWLAHSDGRVAAFGGATDHGDAEGWTLGGDIVGIEGFPGGDGYWMVGADGGVFSFGAAPFYGSMGGTPLAEPVVGMAATPTGGGYWLVAEDGGVFSFGDAGFHGSMGGQALNGAVVGIAASPSGHGYWLVAEDGGAFAFGDAAFYGSMGGTAMNAPVSGIASGGSGYWMVGEDGGVFTYGSLGFYGSMGGEAMNAIVTDVAATPSGKGYWLVGADGGVFAFGDAGFYGSAAE